MRFFRRAPKPGPDPGEAVEVHRRILFLDDDPGRAQVFLAANPDAVWVQTVAECLAKLELAWDEVHLDHDLGGEQFVDVSREDCGMEVVRWLCGQRRTHLAPTRFLVHSHNSTAAMIMGMQLTMSGYRVEVRPFGASEAPPQESSEWREVYDDVDSPRLSLIAGLAHWIRRVLRRGQADTPTEFGYGYTATRLGEMTDESPLEPFDFDWTPPSITSDRVDASAPPDSDSEHPPPNGSPPAT